MADLPQQNTIVQYFADGITTTYIVPFFTPLEPDGTPNLDVFTQLSTATPVPESDINIWGVDYTYTPNLDPLTGGIITFLSGHIPPASWIVTIVRDVQASLDVEFSQAQTFSGFTLDMALDKLLLISQQNKSYTLERNLSYIVNSYLPESTISANVQIPVLQPGYIWIGATEGGVVSAFLDQSADSSTLRSELASEAPVTDGATLVGYYDSVNMNPTTVSAQLTLLTNAVVAPFPTGTIIDFGGGTPPSGFVACNGDSYLVADQPDLFAVIGYTWGGSGANFNVPNLARSVTMGSGGVATGVIGNTVGSTCTGETTALTDPLQLPSHTHGATTTTSTTFTASNVASGSLLHPVVGSASSTSFTLPGTSTTSIADTGESVPFNIVQTSAVVLKCIKT